MIYPYGNFLIQFLITVFHFLSQIQAQVQWDGHFGSISTVQQQKQDVVQRAPLAFIPIPGGEPIAAIGPARPGMVSTASSSAIPTISSSFPPQPPLSIGVANTTAFPPIPPLPLNSTSDLTNVTTFGSYGMLMPHQTYAQNIVYPSQQGAVVAPPPPPQYASISVANQAPIPPPPPPIEPAAKKARTEPVVANEGKLSRQLS
jgi:hypothetical protein